MGISQGGAAIYGMHITSLFFYFFTHVFVDSACRQLTMASSMARNLFNLSGALTDGCVNNIMSFFE